MHSTYNIHTVSFKSHFSRKYSCICFNVQFFTQDTTSWKRASKHLCSNTVTTKLTSLWRGMDRDYFDGNNMNQCYSTGFLWVQKMGKSPGLPTVILKVSPTDIVFWLWSWRWDKETMYFNSGPEGESKRHCISVTLEIQNPKV